MQAEVLEAEFFDWLEKARGVPLRLRFIVNRPTVYKEHRRSNISFNPKRNTLRAGLEAGVERAVFVVQATEDDGQVIRELGTMIFSGAEIVENVRVAESPNLPGKFRFNVYLTQDEGGRYRPVFRKLRHTVGKLIDNLRLLESNASVTD